MRPTVEVEVEWPARRTKHTSFSLPQRGYCWRSWRAVATNSDDQVGVRSRRGRELRSCSELGSLGCQRYSEAQLPELSW